MSAASSVKVSVDARVVTNVATPVAGRIASDLWLILPEGKADDICAGELLVHDGVAGRYVRVLDQRRRGGRTFYAANWQPRQVEAGEVALRCEYVRLRDQQAVAFTARALRGKFCRHSKSCAAILRDGGDGCHVPEVGELVAVGPRAFFRVVGVDEDGVLRCAKARLAA